MKKFLPITLMSVMAVSVIALQADAFWKQGFINSPKGGFQNYKDTIQRSRINISNGVQITLTSTDPATVTKLQSEKYPSPKDTNVQQTVTNITNGIQVTRTSMDAATVTRLQNNQNLGNENHFNKDNNVQRSVQNITNGITITMTSTDPATVTKLQSDARPAPKDTNIQQSITNITNGVQITLTSTDPAIVTKLQNGQYIGREKKGQAMGPKFWTGASKKGHGHFSQQKNSGK